MPDKAREWTDEQLEEMIKRIDAIYSESVKDITKKWNDYMERANKRLEKLQDAYAKAQESGNADEIKAAKEALSKAQKSITLQNKWYVDMVDETTTQLANVNETAVAYLNGQMPSVYMQNYNQISDDAENIGVKFNIVNEGTVRRMIEDGDIELPKKKMDIPKDKRWNTKQLNSSVLQGILQGESMDKIAKRILPVVDNNRNASIRNARTMVTGAENRGRIDSYHDLQDRGLVLRKVWIATADSRTRDWHLVMDGQEVDIDDMFTDGNGNKLEYPGDPSAAPETVYNCRCSQKSHIIGFRKADGSIEPIEYEEKTESLHDRQIAAEEAKRRQDIPVPEPKKDITKSDLHSIKDMDLWYSDDIVKDLNNLDITQQQNWIYYSNKTKYKLSNNDDNIEFFDARAKTVTLFENSSSETFFHETAHAMDNGCINGSYTTSLKRKSFGEWTGREPFTQEITRASEAAEYIYNINPNAWADDNAAFMKWSGMKDKEDLQSLIDAIREFKKEYGEDAANILGDLIDAHTLGEYPMSVFCGGHGKSYWMRNADLIPEEAWAEISSLKALGQNKALDKISEILPNRVESTKKVYNIVFEGGEAYEHKVVSKDDTRISEEIWRFGRKS